MGHRELPRLGAMARTAWPNVVEATLVPLVLFYATLVLVGPWTALLVALGWDYAALLRRLLSGRRVPGLLVLGTVTLTVRTGVAFASGSLWLYFFQPVLGTVAVAGAFALSSRTARPLAGRLAADFWPQAHDMAGRPDMERFFRRLSVLWAVVYSANAAVTVWLLSTRSLSTYLVAKHAVSLGLTLPALVVSVVAFRRLMVRHGLAHDHRPSPSALEPALAA